MTSKKDTDTKLQQGISKHFKAKTMSFGGTEHKIADVTGVLQNNVAVWNNHEQAKLAAHDAYAKAQASEQATAPTRRALVAFIVAHFGASSPVLADFGLMPKKDRRKLNTDEKALMVQRIRATRDARGTLGKRERQAIHGTVPATTPVPPAVTPSAPAPSSVANGGASNGAVNGAATLSLNGLGHA